MNLRFGCLEDLDLIYEIEKEIFTFDGWTYNMIKSELLDENSDFYILEDKNIIGYYCVKTIFDEASLETIGINKKFQGKNYGSYLMQHLVDTYYNYNISLEVRVDNIKGINLYKKFGFKEELIRKDYYGKGKDAIVMWKRNESISI